MELEPVTMWSGRTWAFLALLVSIGPLEAEVVTSISACPQFFLEETPPRIPGILEDGKILNQSRYKPICQTYNSERRFVTLYDINNKIPVFSAYKYIGNRTGRPKQNWRIELQLEVEMTDQSNAVYMNQAGNNDYKNQLDLDRGHLFPSSHAFTTDDKKSTFTLTNIVPQAGSFNKNSWSKMESCVKCVLQKYCINNNELHEGFVVTGAQPSTNNFLNNKINIPSMLWSAFCCYSSSLNRWIASAHWGDNVPDEHTNKYLTTRTLEELHQTLSRFNPGFEVFPQIHCPLNTTVAEFYSAINEENNNCKCPPHCFNYVCPFHNHLCPFVYCFYQHEHFFN
ncbi:endonuclease domain-containing 1 protein-like [Myripristis murdjan]|uniref:endonuclease domain-containing 1 protein-like n=1 Tax=Myripristis murdjan TaxID=586833 RepID=UPI001175E256|nr:endonuclease domain-containing 1 protein-like [Myripristis murdjan]